MQRKPLALDGPTQVNLISAFFFVISGVTVAIQLLILIKSSNHVSIPQVIMAVVYGAAAWFFLNGSFAARWFLVALSVLSVLSGILILWLEGGGGDELMSAFGLFVFLGGSYSLYTLVFSNKLRDELRQRAAQYQAEQEKAKNRFYEEISDRDDEK